MGQFEIKKVGVLVLLNSIKVVISSSHDGDLSQVNIKGKRWTLRNTFVSSLWLGEDLED